MGTGFAPRVAVQFAINASPEKMLVVLWMTMFYVVTNASVNVCT